jgi:leader peptidase (prepilin peptidase)/N-methyltransferase
MVIAYWFVLVFVVGAIVGSFLNVAIARLPLEKSLLWPDSRCGRCLQPVQWYDNLPLLSYLWLRGRCRSCGQCFSITYFLVELGTALGFVTFFYLEVVLNVHGWPTGPMEAQDFYPWQRWVGGAYHALLFSLLMVASVCDLNSREIPLQVTLTGTLLGLIGAVLMPWPWPQFGPAVPLPMPGQNPGFPWQAGRPILQGIYPWPVWGPLPGPLEPGSWQTGLATGIIGALVGTFLLRGIGFLFSTGLGREALGLGDADLMMMAGAFLGWQVIVVGFFLSVIPAIFFGITLLIARRDNSLPFGPSLSLGVLGTMLAWRWIGESPGIRLVFFWGTFLFWLVLGGAIFLFLMSFILRLFQEVPPSPPDDAQTPDETLQCNP